MSSNSDAPQATKSGKTGATAASAKRGAYHGPGTEAELKKQRRKDEKMLATSRAHAEHVLQCLVLKPWLAHPGGCFDTLRGQLEEIISRAHEYRLHNCSETPSEGAVADAGIAAADGRHDSAREGPVAGTGAMSDAASFVPESLTRGVIKALHLSALARPTEFVVQVSACEVRKRMDCKMAAGGQFQAQTRINITDGDNMMLAIVATQLASQTHLFEEKNILRITKYNCISYVPQKGSAAMLALLILGGMRVGTARHVFPKTPGVEIDSASYWTPSPEASPAIASTDSSESSLPQEMTKDLDATDISILDSSYYCDGSLCTTNGIQTRECMLRRQEMPELHAIKPDCFFADRPVDDMSPSHKRCMLYWWWAVNVFQACGKGMRMPLPACIVISIRRIFPNPPGIEYTGFKHS